MGKVTMPLEEKSKQTSELIAPSISETPSTPHNLGTFNRILALIKAMRPRQWTKNLSLFVGLVFAQQLFTLASFERAALAFAAFCLHCSLSK